MDKSPTVLELNAPSLLHNLFYFKSLVKKNTKILAVVKAFGYGSEAIEVAHLLRKNVDYFAVAYTKEGVVLRESGIEIPILVLHPQIPNLENLVNYNLEPNLYNRNILDSFLHIIKMKKIENYPIHLKFNTGLNRLGFDFEDIGWLSEKLLGNNMISIESILSHLVASEDLNERNFSKSQITKFEKITNSFHTSFGFTPSMHMTNTSGILNYPEAHFDMIRIGIGLYGFTNSEKENIILKNVLTLKSNISQIHTLNKGESVGYNRGFIANKTFRTATIPIGHADGISRRLGNGVGYVKIHNKNCPIIGNVCMDMLMVDITDIKCEEGDAVIIFDSQGNIEDLAKKSGTISYELLTAISQRVRRETTFIEK